jgi:hypothetical protein
MNKFCEILKFQFDAPIIISYKPIAIQGRILIEPNFQQEKLCKQKNNSILVSLFFVSLLLDYFSLK